MIGNQFIINTLLLEHKDNPIKQNIGTKTPMEIIDVITAEYWKQWRRELTHNPHPHIEASGLGTYTMMYGKSKMFLRKNLQKLKWYKVKYKDTYQVPGTLGYDTFNHAMTQFKETWKQVDQIKEEVIYNMEIWKLKKIKKYGEKAII